MAINVQCILTECNTTHCNSCENYSFNT